VRPEQAGGQDADILTAGPEGSAKPVCDGDGQEIMREKRGLRVAKAVSKKRTSRQVPGLLSRIPPRVRNAVLIGAGSVLVLVAGTWAYYEFTTIPPPKLVGAKADQVTSYLGDARGFNRLSIPKREEFLANTYQRFASQEDRVALNRALRSMSMQEREVFLDATVDVMRTRVIQFSDEYNRLPKTDRPKFVDNVLTNFRRMQGDLGGRGDPNLNVGEPFKPFAPERSDDWSKMLVSRTTARERAKAQPLIDAVAKRVKETQGQAKRG